ncbi:MAG TPA: tail fiber protein [Dokdonella sp.]
MATPYIGEIRMFGFDFPPRGWATCAGQLLAINQNQALFSLLGTTYGGNGQTTFALPDLRGRAPIHVGHGPGLGSRSLGEQGGTQQHTLLSSELPQHTHLVQVAGAPTTGAPAGDVVLAAPTGSQLFRSGSGPSAPLAATTAAQTGGNQPHPNMQPYAVVNISIALQGIFPSRN